MRDDALAAPVSPEPSGEGLLPCPFCGERPTASPPSGTAGRPWSQVECDSCACIVCGDAWWEEGWASASRAWNRRAPPAPAPAPAQEGAGWRAKPISWTGSPLGYYAISPIGVYRLRPCSDRPWEVTLNDEVVGSCDYEDHAKSLAQSDIEARLRACMEPTPPDAAPAQEGVEAAARVLLEAMQKELKTADEFHHLYRALVAGTRAAPVRGSVDATDVGAIVRGFLAALTSGSPA